MKRFDTPDRQASFALGFAASLRSEGDLQKCATYGCMCHGEVPCELPEGGPTLYYCYQHASENGFCPMCGSVVSSLTNFCDECQQGLDDTLGNIDSSEGLGIPDDDH
jgi:hypothetical protein